MCIGGFGNNETYNKNFSQAKETFQFFHSSLWVTWFQLHYLKIQQPPYLFLISFSNEVSLSYPNSPPAGRGRFTMSAWVATRTTRSGFFSLPPKAEGRKRAISHLPRCGEQTSTLPRWGGVLGLGCLIRWMRLVHFACRLANLCCWSEWPIRSLEGLGLAKDGMSLFPGPQGRLLRSGPEATTEHDEASQIFLQVGLICLLGE